MVKQINKPSTSPVQFNSAIYANKDSFDDYFGGEEIKEKFMEVIDYLSSPEKYEAMGARTRRGIIFYGPPGTGKTMLARSLASEAGCSFIKVVAS
jgi:cell division protease FtsH